MDFWNELRFTAAQVMNDAKRTLLCEPDTVDKVHALVEAMGAAGTFEVKASAACPPGKILVLDEQALTAAQNQALQQIARGALRRP
ncbi:hypothetical protein GTX53_24405 [Streptomyces sp. SID5594]|uniref:hypothetical protein n=1 Tax=unclassified Streptomyces TaxID=2593676 RepID=UPI00037BB018|nr:MULTISPECIES: hypothetical protein [unclassified Streptomyces]MZF56935.1 hypothetical protein [Streptomyces sp. SID5594]